MTELSFPRAHARSRRFMLGRPRSFTVAPDGGRVLFLRSDSGDDPVHHLWSIDPATGEETRVVDVALLGVDDADLPPAERARRERAREAGGGIVAYATDRDMTTAVFTVGGAAWRVDLASGRATPLEVDGAPYDVRPAPEGTRVAAVVDGVLHVGEHDQLRPLVGEDGVAWGVADFVAAEEMRRLRGYWWSPDGTELLVCRVDESDVVTLTIADPANPQAPAVDHRYPLAGTANPESTLWRVDAGTGERREVTWDRDAFPYLAVVRWGADGPPLLLVQSRDQRTVCTLAVDGTATTVVRTDTDPDWIDLVPGTPAWAGDRLAIVVDLADHGDGGSRALVVDDRVLTPPGMQVRALEHVDASTAWLTASVDDPSQVHVVRVDLGDGTAEVVSEAPGVHGVTVGGDVQVRTHTDLEAPPFVTVHARGGAHEVASHPMVPGLAPRVELLELGPRRLRGALLRPDTEGPWPVLLDPYGGPHAQRVLQARDAFLTSAWFADQGFAVLVVDGRGSPGRGPAWERSVRDDLASPPLEDQVDALHAAAELEPRLDLDRVGIRGWSFGGYLAALACVRRPDLFRAGIVGAPVTDWRLYDTHSTERYLGDPDAQPEVYRASSVVDDTGTLVDAAALPDGMPPPELLVIHGLADDNVVAAHSLRLSSALLAAGRPHTFLPLSGVTHMAIQEVVAENLLLLQRDVLRRALA